MKNTWETLEGIVNSYTKELSDFTIASAASAEVIRTSLKKYDFSKPQNLTTLMDEVHALFSKWSLHSSQPGYLGLFVPATTEASIVADALVALYNPQLAVWSHAPIANEIEQHVLRYLTEKSGIRTRNL